jgi:hypothetical protein
MQSWQEWPNFEIDIFVSHCKLFSREIGVEVEIQC